MARDALSSSCNFVIIATSSARRCGFAGLYVRLFGTITVTCGGLAGTAVAYTIRIGTGGSGVYAPRAMRDGTTWQLGYNLFTGASRTLVWGDGTGASRVVADGYALQGRSVTRSYPVYGRIPARQNVAPGRYVDSLVITLEY